MKRLITIFGFFLMLLVGCNKSNDIVTITTNINSYTPSMSSVQGITMTPKFKTEKSYENLVYHWETNEGEFIGLGKEVKNQGESVVWSAIENDKVIDIKKSIDIKLEVIGSESKRVLATTKLTITPDNGFYKVKK
jgi:hypothetical protein